MFLRRNNVIFAENSDMNRRRLLFTALYVICVAAFLICAYRYHIYFQEQFQLFEFTGDYFLQTVAVPGGLADYLARFLTQFSYYAVAGALIETLLILAVQALTFKLTRSFALSFIPATLTLAFLCNAEAMLAFPVALVITLLAANFTCRSDSANSAGAVPLLTILLYFLAGPVAILFPAVKFYGKKRWLPSALLTLMFLTMEVMVFHNLTHYPFRRLLYGLSYYRFFDNMPALPWIAVASIAFVFYLAKFKSLKPKTEYALASVVLLCSAAGIWFAADFNREESMKYDFLARRGQWDAIIAQANNKNPDTPNNVTCLNLALAMKGQLKKQMFNYFQCGTEGLMPPFSSDYLSSLPVSEVYFYLGMINTARRFTFATQENNPSGHKSARCYKRLAETNMVNGLYDAALLYLKPLTHTLFYRQWAEGMIKLLGNEEAIAAHPLYGHLRQLRLHNADFMFNRSTTDSMMAFLINENPKNPLAYEYLYAWLLLDKKLPELRAVFNIQSDSEIPQNYWNYYKNFKKVEESK